MRHYYSPLHRQVDGTVDRSAAGVAVEVERERVRGCIDALDCLLALWVAEATLDLEGAAGEGRTAPAVR